VGRQAGRPQAAGEVLAIPGSGTGLVPILHRWAKCRGDSRLADGDELGGKVAHAEFPSRPAHARVQLPRPPNASPRFHSQHPVRPPTQKTETE
jgi:hypothetical protein